VTSRLSGRSARIVAPVTQPPEPQPTDPQPTDPVEPNDPENPLPA